MFKNGGIRSRRPRHQEARRWKKWTLRTFITGPDMKKQLYILIPSPEFDVVSVSWWERHSQAKSSDGWEWRRKILFLKQVEFFVMSLANKFLLYFYLRRILPTLETFIISIQQLQPPSDDFNPSSNKFKSPADNFKSPSGEFKSPSTISIRHPKNSNLYSTKSNLQQTNSNLIPTISNLHLTSSKLHPTSSIQRFQISIWQVQSSIRQGQTNLHQTSSKLRLSSSSSIRHVQSSVCQVQAPSVKFKAPPDKFKDPSVQHDEGFRGTKRAVNTAEVGATVAECGCRIGDIVWAITCWTYRQTHDVAADSWRSCAARLEVVYTNEDWLYTSFHFPFKDSLILVSLFLVHSISFHSFHSLSHP